MYTKGPMFLDLVNALRACGEEFQRDSDVLDGVNGQRPNRAMKMVLYIDEVLKKYPDDLDEEIGNLIGGVLGSIRWMIIEARFWRDNNPQISLRLLDEAEVLLSCLPKVSQTDTFCKQNREDIAIAKAEGK